MRFPGAKMKPRRPWTCPGPCAAGVWTSPKSDSGSAPRVVTGWWSLIRLPENRLILCESTDSCPTRLRTGWQGTSLQASGRIKPWVFGWSGVEPRGAHFGAIGGHPKWMSRSGMDWWVKGLHNLLASTVAEADGPQQEACTISSRPFKPNSRSQFIARRPSAEKEEATTCNRDRHEGVQVSSVAVCRSSRAGVAYLTRNGSRPPQAFPGCLWAKVQFPEAQWDPVEGGWVGMGVNDNKWCHKVAVSTLP